MELTPGPNMAWLALVSIREGRRAGALAVLGIALGLALLALAAAAGVTALTQTYPFIYELIRWAGVGFLLYLAAEAWVGEKPARGAQASSRHLVRGLVINVLNPKAATVFILLIPTFAGAAEGVLVRTVVLSLVYVAIATAVHLSIVMFASSFSQLVAKQEREQLIRRAFALTLAAVAIWLALTTGRSG